MRNLKLLKSLCNAELSHSAGSPLCVAVRSDTDSLLLASEFSIIEFDPRTGQVVNDVSLTEEGYMPDDGSGKLVGIQELAELESVCVATATGDVILYNLTTNEVECVGSVESGLTSMSWSPDEELVALTTGQQTVIMMTKEFEPITEVGIHQDDFGEGKFITVGWGKKETQFHGSEGKQAAQKKMLPAMAWDDRRPRVSWRGDGQLFAVSAVCPQTGARRVRVWSREGVLQATSESLNGLEQALCWRPSGSLIACTQRHPNKHSVVFMEKNGLLHGDFTLPCSRDQAKVKELLWNSDSTVLLVWLEDVHSGADGHISTERKLWAVGNYHWYLKQSLAFGRDPQRAPACVHWDPQRPLRLHVVTRGWASLTYDWGWATDRSTGLDASDNANVAVIDGDKILVTTFRQGVVPPPMCSYELQLTSPVNLVTFLCQTQKSNHLAAMTADGQISVFGPGRSPSSPHRLFVSAPSVPGLPVAPLAIRQLLWLKEDLLLGLSAGTLPSSSTLLFLSPVAVDGVVTGMAYSFQSRTVALQLEDGQTRRLIWGDGLRIHGTAFQMVVLDANRVLGLVCVCQLASNVSSFVVHEDFLLVTTHAHTCRCLLLGTLTVKGLQEALGSDGGQNDETLRRVERGSKIVTVVTQDTRLILQMPRGNLETVHHRALVLAQLRKQLDCLKFRDAFECMRKLRINLNFMYDHNPKVFLENVETFITQLNSINHINLFLTELREEDTTGTMYPRPLNVPGPSPMTRAKKLDVVCDAFRHTMESMDPDKYCLSILTSHVKKTVPELEIALQKVHDLRGKTAAGVVGAEEALKYLLFLVNVNDLYDHSLGTYDFDLVLMVAEKSQKDPKEYLPFLNKLKTLEPNYQRYSIDKHLKRYSKALLHLSKCGEEHFPEALGLVREQKLFSEALELYPAHSPHYKALSCAYAEHLVAQQQPEQAGLLLWRCGEPGRALQAFVSASSWRHALCVAQQVPLPPDQLSLLARDMAGSRLIDQRRYAEGALLLDQYAKDCEEAISALIKGAVWEEALRLVTFASHTSFLENNTALFGRHRNRLSVVLELKEKARLDMLDEDGPDCPDAELYSEASSVMSNSKHSSSISRISSRSSKNRRKAERKKWSLKEGSPLEDVALLHALADIIGTVDKIRGGELHSLLKALVLFQYDRLAQKLQLAYEEALLMMEAAIPEVWSDGGPPSQTPVTGPDSTANSITASLQNQARPTSLPLPGQCSSSRASAESPYPWR
uniref:Elongator complex protein 1 n=1 Tax=Gadus morhua TaxID=8049 RepID=A0A8C5BRA3_GADMO